MPFDLGFQINQSQRFVAFIEIMYPAQHQNPRSHLLASCFRFISPESIIS